MTENEVVMTTLISLHVKGKSRFLIAYEIFLTGKYVVFRCLNDKRDYIACSANSRALRHLFYASIHQHLLQDWLLAWKIFVSSKAHVQWLNMHRTKTHLKVPNGGNNEKTALFNYKLCLIMNRAKWRKEICLLADISFPHCLATDFWFFAPKAVTEIIHGKYHSARFSGTTFRGIIPDVSSIMKGKQRRIIH